MYDIMQETNLKDKARSVFRGNTNLGVALPERVIRQINERNSSIFRIVLVECCVNDSESFKLELLTEIGQVIKWRSRMTRGGAEWTRLAEDLEEINQKRLE